MPIYYHYNPSNDLVNEDRQLLEILDSQQFDGVFLSDVFASKEDKRVRLAIDRANQLKLKTGILIDCFQGKDQYHSEYFTRPMNFKGAIYLPTTDYYPICPNNPVAIRHLLEKIESVNKHYQPDYIYLNHFQFPFNWEEENLDIQDQTPQYCYCPFCITEFSSVIGEIVTSSAQIEEVMPEWLEWRTDAISKLLGTVKRVIPKKTALIVGLPPLAVIDLPFATGLLPYSIVEEGCFISPMLYHKKVSNKIMWIEDILDQYKIDLNQRKIMPYFQIQNRQERAFLEKLENRFGGLIVADSLP